MTTAALRPSFWHRLRHLAAGLCAGFFAGLVMLLVMAALRICFFLPTPTELIFDRAFPFLTVDFFIGALVRAGGYTPLKLSGVWGALSGQLAAAGCGGLVYAWFMGPRPASARRGLRLVIPGVFGVWLLFVALLWPQLLTNYRGHPPAVATLLSIAGLLISFGSCGLGLMFFYSLLRPVPAQPPAPPTTAAAAEPVFTRRRFLAAGLASLATVLLAGLLRRLFKLGSFGYDGTQYRGPGVVKITPTDKFYQVTKNLVDPEVARDIWRLDLVGQVENPRVFTYEEITALPAVQQETTLQCISYSVNNGLISNAIWTGVPLPTLLALVKPKPSVARVLFHGADGYFETFPYTKAIEQTTLVAWEMNGGPLPARHGFPIRLIVPGIYGERSAKWVTRLEFVAADDPRLRLRRHQVEGVGFYTEQGWGPNFVVPTTSRFDAPVVSGDHFDKPFTVGAPVEFRGMAFGGDKGISQVEVSFDDGHTWTNAPITEPGTRLSWSLWKIAWTPTTVGDCVLLVRATNADGQPQITENRNPVPMGATGLHRVRGKVEAA